MWNCLCTGRKEVVVFHKSAMQVINQSCPPIIRTNSLGGLVSIIALHVWIPWAGQHIMQRSHIVTAFRIIGISIAFLFCASTLDCWFCVFARDEKVSPARVSGVASIGFGSTSSLASGSSNGISLELNTE